MTIAGQTLDAAAAPAGQVFKFAGVVLAMAIPALFWTAVLAIAAPAAGIAATASALGLTGAAIALFLGAVCAPVMLRA